MTRKQDLIGTWRLISQETQFADGRREITRGENPDGILIYDALGNMSVHLVRTAPSTVEHTDLTEFETAMEQYHGYFGTYDVDEAEGMVYHNIVGAAFPLYIGTRQKRRFELEGDTLRLFSEATIEGDDTRRFIIWQRLNGRYDLP